MWTPDRTQHEAPLSGDGSRLWTTEAGESAARHRAATGSATCDDASCGRLGAWVRKVHQAEGPATVLTAAVEVVPSIRFRGNVLGGLSCCGGCPGVARSPRLPSGVCQGCESADRLSRRASSAGNSSPRRSLPYWAFSAGRPAQRGASKPDTSAARSSPSRSATRSSSPCAWKRSPAPSCRPARACPDEPSRPPDTASAPAGTVAPARAGAACGIGRSPGSPVRRRPPTSRSGRRRCNASRSSATSAPR